MNMSTLQSATGYKPLPPNLPGQPRHPLTRILALHPGEVSAPLYVTLAIEDVQRCQPYEALSYVWGHVVSENPLVRDGQPTQIKVNLEAALRSLRHPREKRRLWVDALCIDQNNISERSSQVEIMRLIYMHATRVIVWLGPIKPGVVEAFELARQLEKLREKLPYTPTIALERSPAAGTNLSPNSVKEHIHPNAHAWEYLLDLFKREWWERVWCVQELIVSSTSTGRCGDLEIRMKDLVAAAIYIFYKHGRLFTSDSKTLTFWNDVYLKKFRTPPGSVGHWSAAGASSLLTLLEAVRNFKATDPRDRVFALIGIFF
jgi:hypothetical protein